MPSNINIDCKRFNEILHELHDQKYAERYASERHEKIQIFSPLLNRHFYWLFAQETQLPNSSNADNRIDRFVAVSVDYPSFLHKLAMAQCLEMTLTST